MKIILLSSLLLIGCGDKGDLEVRKKMSLPELTMYCINKYDTGVEMKKCMNVK